jgi:polyisoprenoid-binding protein YceI
MCGSTASVDTTVEAREEDLRSDRFFDVRTFPLITFTGADCALVSDPLWTVGVELTIRDVTRVVTLEVTVRGVTVGSHGRTRIGLTATAMLGRADFGLTTEHVQESGPEGDFDVEIEVDVEAVLDASGAEGD